MRTVAAHPVTRGLRLLSNDTRLELVLALARERETWPTASALATRLGLSISGCWQALCQLSRAGLVEGHQEKRGRDSRWHIAARVRLQDNALSVDLDGFTITVARSEAVR